MNSRTHLLGPKDRRHWCLRNSPYFELVKYLAPVALTLIAIDVGEQALNRSLANSFNAVNNLAGFGIAYVIVRLATGMLSEIKMVSIMLLHNHSGRIRIGICVLVGGCLIFVCSLVIRQVLAFCILISSSLLTSHGNYPLTTVATLLDGFSRFGYYLIDALHRVPPNVSQIAKDSILYLSIFPLIDGFAWLHAGVLLRFKYSVTVGAASLLDNIVQVITVVVMLNTKASRSNPLLIPVLATYFGTLVRLLTLIVAYYKCIHHQLHSYSLFDEQEDTEREPLSFKRIVSFWTPLALVQACIRISKPIVNLFVARDHLGGVTREEAIRGVAVLSVCYPIGRLPYGWLHTLRSIQPAFIKGTSPHILAYLLLYVAVPLGIFPNGPNAHFSPVFTCKFLSIPKNMQEGEAHVTAKNIRIFHLCCILGTCILMVVLFCTPGVAPAILAKVNNVDQTIIRDAIAVLYVYCFYPVPVAIRAIIAGMFVAQKNTKYLYPSVPIRLITLVSMLFILPRLGIHGSLMGMLALISGLLAETLCSLIIAFILYKRSSSTSHAQNMDVDHNDAGNKKETKV